ncbi:ABC transporter ATP-binding protein/permease [Halosquirtibacter xylanolyticus]|uniref:ABC transporter ATP-binding protein n=1 Tax=Halosquirtibacter xylanolyticus TaxID=3374599 RepID=UPI003748439F|nr:ABC transporter ATP-binding protein/permease [Prolixibacteraceae bacterium]
MRQYFQKRFELSDKGTDDFIKGICWSTLQNITLMLPMVFLFLFIDQYFPMKHLSYFTSPWTLSTFIMVGVMMMGLIYMVALFQYDSVYTKVYNESANRRIRLAEKLRKLPISFFSRKDLSELSTRFMTDATDLEHIFSHAVPQLFASIISIGLAFIGLFTLDWRMTLSLFWVLPTAFIVIYLSKKQMSKGNIALHNQRAVVTEKIQEGIELIQEVKTYQQESQYDNEFERQVDEYENKLIHGELFNGACVNGSQAILKLGLPSVILTGAFLLNNGDLSIFNYLIFLTLGTQIYTPIHEVFNNFAVLLFLDVRIHRLKEIHQLKSQEGNEQLQTSNYDIQFKDVSFRYDKGDNVLSKVSFTAKQGQVTALIGPSGGGKTTTVKLAARFWDHQNGTITLGGTNIQNIDPEKLLEHYAIVFQDVVLFNTSIMDNIRLGKKNATDNEVIEAAKLAQCHDFISELPQQYRTVISENGDSLSGGERQRISIARALLKDAPIILLDEATASLDVENESKVQKALSELVKNKTVLIIAHKMRTIANAHHVAVLNKGSVIEQGTPKQLLNNKGYFYRMSKEQHLSEAIPS